ncbi:MAG: YbhB/YbcL family Raf kinase inhibitor-like protein [Parasulfuritortus sp.]|nr:YbhB/YbcL family Raf kinase inhibitor-like protein [Parasulfuritortus sp.]
MFKYSAIVLAAFLTTAAHAGGFGLSSPEIKPGARIANEQVFKGFGCEGGNVSPELAWQGAPKGTKSLAVTAYDPDAPTGSGWWHWVVFNLPADTTGLKKGAGDPKANLMPAGAVQSHTDFGQTGYGGPCPPVGDKPHHYIFTVYALKVDKLPLDENSPAAMVGYYLHQNMLGKATLLGRYGR